MKKEDCFLTTLYTKSPSGEKWKVADATGFVHVSQPPIRPADFSCLIFQCFSCIICCASLDQRAALNAGVGADAVLVTALDFKSKRGARAVPGGFDSHTLPP